MRTEIMTITPAMAEKWLAATTFRNRNVSTAAVNRYANDMSKGLWALNGESIVLDDNGNVIDGQHRLRAILKSGVSIRSVVVRGADQSVFPTFDVGSKRGGHDILTIAGYANGRTLAAILRNVMVFDKFGFGNDQRGSGSVSKYRPDFLKLVEEHSGAIESAAFVQSYGKTCELLRPGSFGGFVHYEFGRQNAKSRDAFFSAIVERDPYFPTSCPTITLWKKYATIKIQKEMSLSHKFRFEVWASSWEPFLKRFNAERKQAVKQLSQLQSQRG